MAMKSVRIKGAAYPPPTKSEGDLASSTALSAFNSPKQQLFNPSNSFDVALRKSSLTSLEKQSVDLLQESAPLSFARPAMAAPTAGNRSVPAIKRDWERTADVATIASP
jgi:hypothetical protein